MGDFSTLTRCLRSVATLLSSLSYVSSIEELTKKYDSIKDKKINIKLPIIVEDKLFSLKTKEIINSLKKK